MLDETEKEKPRERERERVLHEKTGYLGTVQVKRTFGF